MRLQPFTRPTLLAAVEMLARHTQASFDQLTLRLSLEDEIPDGTALSVPKKCGLLGRILVQRPTDVIDTVDGPVTLAEAAVREAIQLLRPDGGSADEAALLRGLARDGYVVGWEERGRHAMLRAALPNEIQLPETDDEVRHLLNALGFATPLGHLGQAIDAHTRGDWAAANGQLRTFLESLFDDIARAVRPAESDQLATAENRRALLTQVGFLAADRREWTPDGKGYVNGLFKMLHTEGSHPGLSDEDHCTFRLHVVLVTARTFLRRLYRQA